MSRISARAVVGLDEQAEGRAPAHRLEASAPGAEQVDHPRAVQHARPVGMGENVEHALPRPVPGRARAHPLRRREASSLCCPAMMRMDGPIGERAENGKGWQISRMSKRG